MGTIADAVRRIENFQNELIASMPAIALEAGGVFLAAKIEQIRKMGVGLYNSNVYSAHFLKGKELNASGKSFIATKLKNKERTNWAEFRKAQGLQSNFVDLYYSGQMLNSTGIINVSTVTNTFFVTLGGRNAEAKAKLEKNRERYGDFLKPNAKQSTLMNKRALKLITDIYKKNLLIK